MRSVRIGLLLVLLAGCGPTAGGGFWARLACQIQRWIESDQSRIRDGIDPCEDAPRQLEEWLQDPNAPQS